MHRLWHDFNDVEIQYGCEREKRSQSYEYGFIHREENVLFMLNYNCDVHCCDFHALQVKRGLLWWLVVWCHVRGQPRKNEDKRKMRICTGLGLFISYREQNM